MPPPPPLAKDEPNTKSSKSDYIKISECHSGLPLPHRSVKSMSFNSKTLKPSPSNCIYSSHQKSRSLTENHSSYTDLDLPSFKNHAIQTSTVPKRISTLYHPVDFDKTQALNKCKEERSCRTNDK